MLTSAFTCIGPYAVLIMLGIKRVENRSAMPEPAKGRCAVGCSKSFCREEYGKVRSFGRDPAIDPAGQKSGQRRFDDTDRGRNDRMIVKQESCEKIHVQNAAGDANTCASIVNAFVASNVDLIMANATPALQAAQSATGDIPILGTSVTEYGVALDIKDFNGTVGGNVSGTSDLAPLEDQAAMLQEWFPDAKNVAMIYCSAEPNSKYQVDTMKKLLEEKGYTCQFFAFTDSNDMQAVVNGACEFADVIYLPTDNAVASSVDIIDSICRPAGIPIIAGEAGVCAGCGIATLSIDYYDLGYATGEMAVRILKDGADITKMPIEYAPEVSYLYNEEICKELNITPLAGYNKLVTE